MSETKKEPIKVNELSKKIYHHMSGIDKNEFNDFVGELVKIGVFTENSSEKLKSFVSDKDKEEEMTSLVYDCLKNIKESYGFFTKEKKDKWNYIPINLVEGNKCKSIAKFLKNEKILDDPDKKFIKTNFKNNNTTRIKEYIDIISRTLLNNDNLKLEPDDEEDLMIFKLQCGEKGSTTLYSAIENKWKKVVKYLIESTKIIEEEEKKEIILDVFSDYENYKEIADLMLDFFIKENQNLKKELFYLAAKNGYVELLKKLIIEYKVNLNIKFNNKTILQIAVKNGQTEIIKYLVDNSKYSLLEEVDYIGNIFKNNHSTHIVYIINKMLFLAAEQGKFNLLIKLINKYKVDPNTKFDNNKTILHIATENNQISTLNHLKLRCVNLIQNLILEKTTDGKTALQLAYEKFGVCELTRFLSNEIESALKSNVRKMAKDRILFETNISKITLFDTLKNKTISQQLQSGLEISIPDFTVELENNGGTFFICDHIFNPNKISSEEEKIKHNILIANLEYALKNCASEIKLKPINSENKCPEITKYKKKCDYFGTMSFRITIANVNYNVYMTLSRRKDTNTNNTHDYELYDIYKQ